MTRMADDRAVQDVTHRPLLDNAPRKDTAFWGQLKSVGGVAGPIAGPHTFQSGFQFFDARAQNCLGRATAERSRWFLHTRRAAWRQTPANAMPESNAAECAEENRLLRQ